ncbi:host cell division inhibitor Icd-like protein [Raoultella scottii]|uniref:host cell division inhibitor Icd-like protein n=1 Tax=Raoultella scottii TaxID=3040937 RepID=UPI002F9416A9
MLNKTKAALQSCQCHYGIFKQSQHTRVNVGGQRMSQLNFEDADFIQLLWQSQKVRFAYNSLIPAFFLTLGKKGGISGPTLWLGGYRHIWRLGYSVFKLKEKLPLSLELGSWVTFMSPDTRPLSPQYANNPTIITKITTHLFGTLNLLLWPYDFGSMPRCCNSFRTIRLSQAERVASPSSCMAASIASSSAGSTRKAICLLPLGIFVFDMCLTLGVIFIVLRNVHHVSYTCKARSPAVLPALTGPLTKPLIGVTVMADQQHTQTHPKFTWCFLSTSERYPTAKPLVIYVNASSEQEARDTMPGVNLIFAARLPFHAFQAMEVRHV